MQTTTLIYALLKRSPRGTMERFKRNLIGIEEEKMSISSRRKSSIHYGKKPFKIRGKCRSKRRIKESS